MRLFRSRGHQAEAEAEREGEGERKREGEGEGTRARLAWFVSPEPWSRVSVLQEAESELVIGRPRLKSPLSLDAYLDGFRPVMHSPFKPASQNCCKDKR